MMLGNPKCRRKELSIDEVDQHRRIDCENYCDCLDYAAARQQRSRWQSWSCQGCEYYVARVLRVQHHRCFWATMYAVHRDKDKELEELAKEVEG